MKGHSHMGMCRFGDLILRSTSEELAATPVLGIRPLQYGHASSSSPLRSLK
eukprot:m.138296 g.138296  ORF g.138296 m.138296 type:complete len:51 (+) comp13154_c4_seq16:3159-3311(+)